MSGNGTLQASPEQKAALAREFWRGHRIKGREAGWDDMNESERASVIATWRQQQRAEHEADLRTAQEVERRLAATTQRAEQHEPPERPKVKVKDLADLVWNLEQEGQVQVTTKTLVLVVKMFNEELSRAINKREANTRSYIDEQLERVRADAHERYKAEVRMKNAEVSALRTHNDALAWQLSEAQAALAGRAVRPPSAKLYYQPRRNGNGAHDDD